ncbi:hypothetical protein CcrMagneto_gp240 [Caulobacter virus Magneto]|uniref:hypothetical protein n=1 Tax=Caulobacter virus Magneto TaxID=1211642 RepID=UPI00028BB795|nr:hypothetical protein CcrMagneto_gp240 [Caulobacter virus Magneto]AFU87410.1 hypothetical protein CcrMagneto_gp240 [Caulobacter virus Magneto]
MSGVDTESYKEVRMLTLQAAALLTRLVAERDAASGAHKTGMRKLVLKAEEAYNACLSMEELMDGAV